MKYEIIRITNSSDDYLRVNKGELFLDAFWIVLDKAPIRSYDEAFKLAKERIEKDLDVKITQTVYTYEA
jgi:hypothetical protein